jgi:dTDP-4-amino-4,6-dideoxygalactose transaminase
MNNIQANIGIAQLTRYKYFYNQKKNIYQFYKNKIKSSKNIKNFFNLSNGDGYFWVYPILVKKNKLKFFLFLKNKKIILSHFWKALSKQKPYRNFMCENVYNSENITKNIICLPSSTFLSNRELNKIVKTINNF